MRGLVTKAAQMSSPRYRLSRKATDWQSAGRRFESDRRLPRKSRVDLKYPTVCLDTSWTLFVFPRPQKQPIGAARIRWPTLFLSLHLVRNWLDHDRGFF